MFKDRVSVDEIRDLYLNRGLKAKDLASTFNVSARTIARYLKTNNIYKQKQIRHIIDHAVFSKFSIGGCYWAGFIAADGNIYKNQKGFKVKLSSKDENHLHKLCDFLKRDHKLYTDITKLNNKEYMSSILMVHSKDIADNLKSIYNITSNKTFTLESPNLPNYFIPHYIRGFMDGDGSIMFNGKRFRVHFVSASAKILYWIKNSFKIATGNKTGANIIRRKNKNFYEFELSHNNAREFINWIYNGSDTSNRLSRKYNIFKIGVKP